MAKADIRQNALRILFILVKGSLKTYREALAQFHLSPESKFLNGEPFDHGRTERRHIKVSAIACIGKEAKRWEEQFYVGFDESAEIDYGAEPGGIPLDERLRRSCAEIGQRKAAERYGFSRSTLIRVLKNGPELRIPTKPAMHSNLKPATYSDLKPASVPI